MRHHLSLFLCCAAAGLVVATVAYGQTFSYSENFNGVTAGEKPPGWNTLNSSGNAALDPKVLDADPAGWGLFVPYGVAWSGGKRFNLIHAGEDAGGRAAVAWYSGVGGPHSGTYPMALQTNKMKVAFDLSTRTGTTTPPADGGVFAVQPVTDAADLASAITRVGAGGGGMAWAGLTGFAIEFDIWDNGAPTDPVGADIANHIGLDVFMNGATSLTTNVDKVGEGVIPRFLQVGDNNQPMHITIYYNDPAEGGIGTVRVYLKVDPATYEGTGTAMTYGMSTGHPDGQLVLDACVGAWPTSGAIFGFTGSTGGANSVYQMDNLVVTTDLASGTACKPIGLPTFDPGPDVLLDPAGSMAGAKLTDLSQPGWHVSTYPTLADNMDGCKGSLAYDVAHGILPYASVTGEQDLNYSDDAPLGPSCNVAGDRWVPGLAGGSHDYYSIVATGWIYFAPDDGSKPYPRAYPLNLNSDDGFEVLFGTGLTNQVAKTFTGGRGCEGDGAANSIFNLIVSGPGVYPIQVIQFEMGGGSNLEFYRRSQMTNTLLRPPSTLIGTATGGQTDQPLVFGLYQGKPAPDLLSTYAQLALPTVNLSPSQKLGDASVATGNQVFKVMATAGPFNNVEERNWEDDTAALGMGWCDTTIGFAANATSATVNFREPGQGDGPIPNGSNFPGLSSPRDVFAFRAQGYIVFPTADTYILGVDSDDDAWVKIGKQTIYSTGCCPNTKFMLNVTEPGTYPVRVYLKEGGGDSRIDFYQFSPAGTFVSVNAPESSIKVYESATTGEYDWESNYWNVPASRKVADPGQGGELGWNATLGKAPAGATMSATLGFGIVEVVVHNSFAGWPGDPAVLGTDTPNEINYVDTGEGGGNFGNDRSVSNFNNAAMNPAGGNDQFGIAASCYLDIPAAGTYAFGLNGDDGMQLWIGGEIVITFPYDTGPQDFSPGFVHFAAPGLYEARVISWENGGGYSMECFQYMPDGSRALINSDQATVKAYRTLASAAAAAYDPTYLPLSAKAAPIDRGGDSGARAQLVNGDFAFPRTGNGDGGVGHEKLHLIPNAVELLDATLGVKPSLSQFGTVLSDSVVPTIDFNWGDDGHDDFAMRATGYLALTKGGHIMSVNSDDGFELRMNGNVIGRSQHLKGGSERPFAVFAPEDGLYAFTLDYFERGGGAGCTLKEYSLTAGGFVVVNSEGAMKMYANVNPCPIPFADADRDNDVDQMDFAAFQLCFTGTPTGSPPVIPPACSCFNPNRDQYIDALDFAAFQNCYTGPSIPWAATADCPG